MTEFSYNLKIKAENKEKANEVVRSLQTIYQKASTPDLIQLAKAVEKNPGLIKKAMKYLKFM